MGRFGKGGFGGDPFGAGGFGKGQFGIAGKATPVPSYSNPGGTGDRRGSITASTTVNITSSGVNFSDIIDGNTSQTTLFFDIDTVSGKEMKFDFGSGASKLITAFKWYQSGISTSQGVWQLQGSNDNSNWTSIGGTFTLTDDTAGSGTEFTQASANTTGYRYYRLLGVSGNTSNGPYTKEIEFKIDNA